MSDLIEVRDLSIEFDNRGIKVPALDRVSFRIEPGATLALVGESGSGKSVTAQAIMRILPPTAAITSGEILFTPPGSNKPATDIVRLGADGRRIRRIRGRHISMIFQEPMVSLSPLHTIGDQVSEALFLHHRVGHKEGIARTQDMLRRVGFPDPARALKTYPFQLSGGLRQRAMIAMALVCRPSLLIADEPTTALDVTIQAQILALIKELQAELEMAVLIITHDLGVVANVAEHVVVLYAGRVMEQGPVQALFERPQHPYLRALLRAVPHFDMKPGERLVSVRTVDHQTGPLVETTEPWPVDAGPVHLEVRNVVKTFAQRSTGFLVRREGPPFRAVDDVSLSIMRGQCFGLVGESGCGKTTLSKVIMRALEPDGGEVRLQRPRKDARRGARARRGADAVPPPRAVHLPGPVRIALPADDGIRHPARAARHPRHRRRRLPGPDGEGADAARRARSALPEPLSAQLLGRAAAAHRHRARARAQARSDPVRRAGVRARRVDPGAGAESAEGPAGRARAHVSLHLPQSRGGRLHRRRDRRDVPRTHRRDRAARSAVPQSDAPVHAGTCSPQCLIRT